MSRVLISPDAVHDRLIAIRDRETLHHLRRVLRVKTGDRLECVDGQGHIYQGAVARCEQHGILIEVEQRLEEPAPALRLTLAQALIKPDHFEWAIQKATELGVARIVPLVTSRTTVRAVSGKDGARMLRWKRIVAAASAQCGRARLPELASPEPFTRALERLEGCEGLLFTAAEPGVPMVEALRGLKRTPEVAVFIGPEGDFSPEEVALAQRQGLYVVRLGRTILRAETAAVAALSILQYAFGELAGSRPR